MRVGVGVILSVLSFSVLAAVIPTYDDHGLLLAQSGASTEASTGAGGSNLDYSSGNRGVSKLGKLRNFFKKLYLKLKTKWYTRGQRIIWRRGEKAVKNAVKRVTEAVESGEAKQVLLEINELLSIALKLSQATIVLFDIKAMMPFVLSNPKGDNQKSFLKEMAKMKNIGEGLAKKYFGDVTRIISAITKRPQDVVKEMRKITESTLLMTRGLAAIYAQEYKDLLSKVGPTGNEKNIEKTQKYVSDMQDYRKEILNAFKYIKGLIENGGVTFKVRARSKFSTFKSGVRNRLGIKKKSSTGVPSDQDELDQEESAPESLYQGELNLGPSNRRPPNQGSSNKRPPGQGPSNQGPSNQRPLSLGPSNLEPSNPEPSNPGPPGQGPSNQGPSNPGPSNQRPSNPGPPGQGPSNQGPSDKRPPGQGPSDSESSNQRPSNPGPPGQGPSNQGPSNPGPSNQRPSNQGPSNSESSNQRPSNQGPSNSESSNQGPSNKRPPGQGPSNQVPSNPEPSNPKSSNSEPSNQEPSDEDTSDQHEFTMTPPKRKNQNFELETFV
ncbi:hypothetical protein BASA83_007742 [Batrachochytrium salamandrivorans]|nr:hypothetical protein BASA83_007742 [Batrachochytrium salamandrivorans]